jgi:hypothetical protein
MQRSRILAVVLAWLLTGPVIAAPQKTVEKVMKFPDGCLVEVALSNGETLRGRLGNARQDGFRVQSARQERVLVREVSYEQVKSIRKTDSGAVSSQAPTIQERVLAMAEGTLVDVRLSRAEQVSGTMGPVTDKGFVLKSGSADREVAFADVASVRPHRGPMSAAAKVGIGAGIAFFVLCIMVGRSGN